MIVDVVVPYRVGQSFHYEISSSERDQLQLGSVIEVPLGTRKTHAFVLGFPESTSVPENRMRSIEKIISDIPAFDEPMLKFYRWVADYYCYPLGEVIAAAIPKVCLNQKYRSKAPVSPQVDGQVEQTQAPELNDEQRFAVSRILENSSQRPVLLHGVTGSGKTEVYMAAMAEALSVGKGALVLVPEIALTPQLWTRFSSRFPGKVAVLHSDLTPRERWIEWERVRKAEATIAVGARSAVFAPVKDLGLIIVDEEHETSFKQEDSLRYHARDLAVVRGKFQNAKVILGSATPSLESYHHSQSGKYDYITLKNRVESKALPKIQFVDMRSSRDVSLEGHPWLSRVLLQKVRQTISQGHQAMLFLNRLGYAHFLYCADCGHTWKCLNCDVTLTYYRHPPGLKCHYCALHLEVPSVCEACSGTKLQEMGLGTEQVEQAFHELLPEVRTARMDRSVIKTRKDLIQTLKSVHRREVDLLIGTQMMAKGHDFPGITLVGVLMADASLNMPDFRANEKTFQLITQVSGRAGRGDLPGEVILQTICPEHPVLQAAAEYRWKDFYDRELQHRKQFNFSPWSRLAMIRFQHSGLPVVESYAEGACDFLRKATEALNLKTQILGPSPAPLSRIKNKFRWQCLIRAESVGDLQRLLKQFTHYQTQVKSRVESTIDVDPMHAM